MSWFRFWLVHPRAVLSKLGVTCSCDRLVPGLLVVDDDDVDDDDDDDHDDDEVPLIR